MLSASIDALYKNKQHNINLPSPPVHQTTSMTKEQWKYCTAIMRNLKKHRDATPFLNPVDYVKLNVPDYPSVITQPMNLLKVDEKLNNMEYTTVDDFIADVRLIFSNCFKYNGPEASISILCQNVESAFEKGLRRMPPSVYEGNANGTSLSAASSPASVGSPIAETSNNDDTTKREASPATSKRSSPSSETTPDPNKSQCEDIGRPKREIHCPSKDYPETYTAQKQRVSNNDRPLKKFCQQTLKEMKKSKYRNIAYPFLQPVDPVALGIPDYPTIVKHPMDLSTIEKKLQNEEYESDDAFAADVELMFNNCYLYNPPHLPIYHMAKELEKVFRDKWAQRPINSISEEDDDKRVMQIEQSPLATDKKPQRRRQSKSSKKTGAESSASTVDDVVDPRDVRLAELERQLVDITQQIEAIKAEKKAEAEATEAAAAAEAENRAEATVAPDAGHKRRGRKPGSKNKQPSKRRKSASNNAVSTKRKRLNDSDMEEVDNIDDEFSFEEKKELSELINELGGDELNEVVAIIQSSMPNLGESGEEEITLDIDALDKQTLRRLSDFISTKVKPIVPHKKELSSSESDDLGQHRSESSSSDSD